MTKNEVNRIWERVTKLNEEIAQARTWFLENELDYHEFCALIDPCIAEQKQLILSVDQQEVEK